MAEIDHRVHGTTQMADSSEGYGFRRGLRRHFWLGNDDIGSFQEPAVAIADDFHRSLPTPEAEPNKKGEPIGSPFVIRLCSDHSRPFRYFTMARCTGSV